MPVKTKLFAHMFGQLLGLLKEPELRNVFDEMDRAAVERVSEAVEKRLNPKPPKKPARN